MNNQTIAIAERNSNKAFGRGQGSRYTAVLEPETSTRKPDAPGNQRSATKPRKRVPTPPVPPIHGASHAIVFKFNHPSAREVLLVAEFTEWEKNPVALTQDDKGAWQITMPLPPGKHRYRYLVDGEWHDDPHAVAWLPNPFGTWDCVVEVG